MTTYFVLLKCMLDNVLTTGNAVYIVQSWMYAVLWRTCINLFKSQENFPLILKNAILGEKGVVTCCGFGENTLKHFSKW